MKTKKKVNATTPAIHGHCACLLAYDSNELLLLAKVFMFMSYNAKQSTNKKANNFCEEISQLFVELIATTNHLNKQNPEYKMIEMKRGFDSLHN